MSREELQITDLEPSYDGSISRYTIQVRGIDAEGRPGPWSEPLYFESPETVATLESKNYVAGSSGWRIVDDGDAEFNGVTVRGNLASSNYVPNVSGWSLTDAGIAEFSTGIFRGALQIGQNTFNVTANGDLFIGGSTLNNSPFAVRTNGEVVAMSLNANFITAGFLSVNRLAAGSIEGGKLSNNTITDAKIANGTITGAKIAGGTITGANIADATVSGAKISASTITGGNIANATITGGKIVNATITGAKIQDATITSAKIDSLDAGKITAGTMSADRIFGGTLGGANIFNFGNMSISSGATITLSAVTFVISNAARFDSTIRNPGMALGSGDDVVRVSSDGRLARVLSSRRYKKNIKPAGKLENLLNVRPVYFDYKKQPDVDLSDQKNIFGGIAEEFDDLGLSALVNYSEEGPESINYKAIGLALIPYVKELYDKIEELERKLNGA